MRTIILGAGQGFYLDGYIKLLIKHPVSGERIIDQYLRIFSEMDVTVVVGYKAIEVIHLYPQLDFVYNPDWKVTNNAYSLGLALNDEPCFVISGDLFVDHELVNLIKKAEPNCILTGNRENRELNSLNCAISGDRVIHEIYQGPRRNNNDPEAIGVYKISNRDLLQNWRKNCIRHGNLFAGQNLRFDLSPVFSVDKGNYRLDEVNTVLDYLNIIKK